MNPLDIVEYRYALLSNLKKKYSNDEAYTLFYMIDSSLLALSLDRNFTDIGLTNTEISIAKYIYDNPNIHKELVTVEKYQNNIYNTIKLNFNRIYRNIDNYDKFMHAFESSIYLYRSLYHDIVKKTSY